MKKIIVILAFSLIGAQALAAEYCMDPNTSRQRYLKSDHISCRVERARNILKDMSYSHQTMTKQEIIEDIENYVTNKAAEIDALQRNANRSDRRKFDELRESFLSDAKFFLDEVKKQETVKDILLLEFDIVTELNEFDYSAYGDTISQVNGEGAAIGLLFGAIIDGASAPFQAINNKIQYSQTKWSRKLASFLINY